MILIIDKSRKDGKRLQEMLYHMGIISCAIVPSELWREISPKYRSVIINSPEGIPNADDYIKTIKGMFAETFVYARTSSDKMRSAPYFDAVFGFNTYTAVMLDKIKRLQGRFAPGNYRLAGIDASVEESTVTFFGRRLPYTKTETMILRTLIKLYPFPKGPKDILKYAFRSTRLPEPSSIRTHISSMNKKTFELYNRKMICMVEGKGYRLITPEFPEIKKEAMIT